MYARVRAGGANCAEVFVFFVLVLLFALAPWLCVFSLLFGAAAAAVAAAALCMCCLK